MSFVGKLMHLEIIVFSELSQSQANIIFSLSLVFPRFYIDAQKSHIWHDSTREEQQ